MRIENHRIICGKRGKNPSEPINSPFTGMSVSHEHGIPELKEYHAL